MVKKLIDSQRNFEGFGRFCEGFGQILDAVGKMWPCWGKASKLAPRAAPRSVAIYIRNALNCTGGAALDPLGDPFAAIHRGKVPWISIDLERLKCAGQLMWKLVFDLQN